MTRRSSLLGAISWPLAGVLIVAGCSSDQAVAPRLGDTPGISAAAGAKPLTVTPTALTFSGTGAANATTFVVHVQFAGLLRAARSNSAIATVSPASTTVAGFTMTFTVTPVGAGNCTITVTDKKGDVVTVAVRVSPLNIAFVSTRDDPQPEIYVMNADGTNPTRLTNNAFDDVSPAFSPHNTKIVFAGTRMSQGLDQIFVMNADGSGETQRTTMDGDYPDFSPDGTKIVFTDETDPAGQIAVMNTDGSNLV